MQDAIDSQFGDCSISNELRCCDQSLVSRRAAELGQTTEDYALVV